MKRLFALLAVVGLLIAPVSPAQAWADSRTPIPNAYVAYLPLVVTPPCSGYTAYQYASVNEPVVGVGEPFTITGVLMNEGCTVLSHLVYAAWIHSSTGEAVVEPGYTDFVVGPQREDRIQWTFALTDTGEYTITVGASFLAEPPSYEEPGMWGGADSRPVVIRVRAMD
jgi:hypothetical protein